MKAVSCILIFLVSQSCAWGATHTANHIASGIEPSERERSSRLFEEELQCLLNAVLAEAELLPLGDRELSLDIPTELIMNISMENMVVANLSSTVSNSLSMSGLLNPRLDADITIPLITITADHYKLWADIFLFEIIGEGSALLYVRDLNLKLSIRLRAGSPTTVTAVESSISIREVETHLENLMDGGDSSDVMNEILSDMVPILVEDMQDYITDNMNALIKDMVGDIIKDITIPQMIAIITDACK